MLLAMFTVFFQFQRASMNFETRTGNETLFTRGSSQLSWILAREVCDNMSYSILSGMRAERALGLLHVGEFAWIDGKEYTFCYAQNVNETKEICRYVTIRREDTRNNLTYICKKEGQFERNEDILSHTDAVKQCLTSSASLLVVENFVLPMIVPVNRTYWIKDYNATSIINILSPTEKVMEICIGIVKLDRDKFEFGTTSCDENHTVICDANVIHTALTLTTRNEMMPRLGDLKGSNQPQADDLIYIVFYSTLWVLPFAISIVVIVQYRKKRLNKSIANNSIYRTRRSDAKRRQDRETLPRDHFMRCHNESESKSLPCYNYKIEDSTEGQGNNPRDASDDEGYDNFDPQFGLYENPINANNSTSRYHIQGHALLAKHAALCNGRYDHLDPHLGLYEIPINTYNSTSRFDIQGHELMAKHAALCKEAMFSENEKGLFPARETLDPRKYMSMHANEGDNTIGLDTENENLYENFNQVAMPLENQYDKT